jgi:hypothetical protein
MSAAPPTAQQVYGQSYGYNSAVRDYAFAHWNWDVASAIDIIVLVMGMLLLLNLIVSIRIYGKLGKMERL